MSFDCRSIRNKTHEVMDFVNENEVDLYFFHETLLKKMILFWLKKWLDDFEIFTECKHRASDTGGGLAFLYRKCLRVNKFKLNSSSSFKVR